jgi:hypothetical protein
MGSLCEFEPVR